MLTAPWALLSLLAIPVVFGIYFFRTRSRRREVSSLFLWVDRKQAKQGGRRIQTLQLPLLILLEILGLALLGLAASRPMFRSELAGRPTTIILDASYSMTAKDDNNSTQERAIKELHRMLDNQIGFPVRFILAGIKPQLVAGRARNAAEAREMLKDWRCDNVTADLDSAVSLAVNVSTKGTKILVVTDHPPQGDIIDGKVLWKSFGKPQDNFAIVHSSRVFHDERDRLLLEMVNFSKQPRQLRMNIVDIERKRPVFRDEKLLEPLAVHRIRTSIPKEVETLEVRLDQDALEIDNRLTVLPPSRRPLRVRIAAIAPELRSKLERAIEVSGMAKLVSSNEELLFDSTAPLLQTPPSTQQTSELWTVRIVSPSNAETSDSESVKSFVGPYWVDPQHPVTMGLSLAGVVWSANEDFRAPGVPVISVGDVPLLTEQHRRNGSRLLTMQLNDRLSTLTAGPAWPILIWNLLKYRSSQRPGIAVNNLQLGSEAEFIASTEDKTLQIANPDGQTRELVLTTSSARIPADHIGVYKITSESGEHRFSVGTLSPEESNLLKAATETHGNWFDEETLRSDFIPLAWALLLGVLALLILHHALISVAKAEVQNI